MPSPNFAPLRHPAWWGALALLALNDHVLKGAGLLPGALTGKLSDLAGLIVAPVLLAALVGARSRHGRIAAFVVVALPFAAINLSPMVAASWDAALGWSTTTDPTDLFALLVAPVAIALAGIEHRPGGDRVPRAAIALGGLACIATSGPEPIEVTNGGPILEHQSDEEVVVRVRWVDASLDCDWLLGWMDTGGGTDVLARALDPSLFDEASTFRLEPGQSADLTRPTAGDRACDALILSADGLEPRMVAYPMTAWSSPGTLTLEPRRDGFRLSETGALLVATPQPSAEPVECERATPIGTFSWAGSAPPEATVRGRETFSDDCFALDLEELPSEGTLAIPEDTDPSDPAAPPRLPPIPLDTHRLTLCVPEGYGDFEVGEQIRVESAPDWIALSGERQGLTLTRLRGLDPSGLRPLCEGARLACGGYAEPIAWLWEGERLSPGEPIVWERMTSAGATRLRTSLLDDATRVVASHPDCGRDVGPRGVVLTHWEDHR